MKSVRNIMICVVIAALLIGGSFFGYTQYIEHRNNRVIATVNGENILYGELNYYVQQTLEATLSEYGKSFEELKEQTNNFEEYIKETALQQAIRTRIVCQHGKNVDGMEPNDYDKTSVQDEKNVAIEAIGGQENFQKQLKQFGMTEQQYDDLMMINYIAKWQALLQYEKLKLPEDQLKEKYENEFVKAQHIYFAVDEMRPDDEAQKQVKIMYDLMENGGDFFVLMNTYSQDPDLTNNPDGILFAKGEMSKPFEEMAFSLQVGQIATDAVRTEYGYHIIKRVDHVSLFENNKEEINNRVAQLQYDKNMEEVFNNAVIERNERNIKKFKVKRLLAGKAFDETSSGQ